MSQQLFADRLGKSKSWVDKVERGVRRLDRFSTIAEIAEVLQVDVQVLMGGREPARRADGGNGGVDPVEVAEIRAALERYDKISSFAAAPPEPPALPDLRKAVDHAWMTFQHSSYARLAKTLPKLIRDAQAADASIGGSAAPAGERGPAHLLAEVYLIASSTLHKLGEHDLAWLAADRAAMICKGLGEELLAALAAERVAGALNSLGRTRPALEISLGIANQVVPRTDKDATPQRLSVYGMSLLQGAMAAARLGDAAMVRELLAVAEEAAAQVGDENFYWTAFGPTNVAFYRVAAEVELGEAARALATHQGIDPEGFAAMMPERRASYLLNLARAYAQIGDLPRAGEVLMEAHRVAPNEIRCRPEAQGLVAELVRRCRTPAPGVLGLMDQIGRTAA
jgi:transcriptional regulator with XRE-family HTH domain